MPIEIYALFAALAAFALQKRWWGLFFFCASILVWLLLMQIVIAIQMHAGLN
jgi:hypothetical protein